MGSWGTPYTVYKGAWGVQCSEFCTHRGVRMCNVASLAQQRMHRQFGKCRVQRCRGMHVCAGGSTPIM